MTDCCDSVCDVDVIDEQQRRTLKRVLAINVLMFVVVLIAALFAKSSSLLSGSIDNLGDAFTYALSLYAVSRGNHVKARVSLIKGMLIFIAATAVTGQIMYKILNPAVPLFELMGLMTILSLGANFLCLGLLTKHRDQDINMASVWECSRNDVIENLTVLFAAIGVWLTNSQWPDILIALALILILYRSAFRIIRLSIIEIKSSEGA